MIRPKQLVVIAGTDTEVGKTWVATRLLALERSRGQSVAARKPAQSFDPAERFATDAELLAQASGESAHAVCPPHRWYPLAMAPPMAADELRRPRLQLDELLSEITWPQSIDVGLLETAGGVLSPIAYDGDNIDLIRRIDPDQVILVADAGLGTINAVRLCMRALSGIPTTVFLNRFDPSNRLHQLNRQWLQHHHGIDASTEITVLRRTQ